MDSTTPPPTFTELLREGNKFTDRDFMKVLGISHTKLKRLEADPSLFTVNDLMVLALLIEKPIKKVMAVVLEQVAQDEQAAQEREEAVKQATGRKYYPRKPKQES
ncbi:hypothetical protein [Hymenobacter cavernae]|uniref:XRE family transcriptional regulator n=1 Tax=Hymenobacter cavernae TaxID=2044852 RepID=A0ABQ1UWN2_9BACT|nr:hypothetical protein [Hymenobacter cavernae]GGF27107.1 hypothetical protein GCM10011383_43380 [Hymenobacter cavernae]